MCRRLRQADKSSPRRLKPLTTSPSVRPPLVITPAESTVEQATFYLQANSTPTTGIDTHVTLWTSGDHAQPCRSPPWRTTHLDRSYDGDAGSLVETEKVSFQYIEHRYAGNGRGRWLWPCTGHWREIAIVQAVDVAETALRT